MKQEERIAEQAAGFIIQHVKTIGLFLAVALIASIAVALLLPNMYESYAVIMVNRWLLDKELKYEYVPVKTYQTLFMSAGLIQPVKQRMGIGKPLEYLLKDLEVEMVDSEVSELKKEFSPLLVLRYRGPSPERAKAFVDAWITQIFSAYKDMLSFIDVEALGSLQADKDKLSRQIAGLEEQLSASQSALNDLGVKLASVQNQLYGVSLLQQQGLNPAALLGHLAPFFDEEQSGTLLSQLEQVGSQLMHNAQQAGLPAHEGYIKKLHDSHINQSKGPNQQKLEALIASLEKNEHQLLAQYTNTYRQYLESLRAYYPALLNMQAITLELGQLEQKKLKTQTMQDEFTIKVLSPPFTPDAKAAPNRKLIVALALVAGFFFAVAYILIRDTIRAAAHPE